MSDNPNNRDNNGIGQHVEDHLNVLEGKNPPKKRKKVEKKEKSATTPPANIKVFAAELPPVDYDVEEVKDFINTVFHDVEDEDEHVLGWAERVSKKKHSYPYDEDNFYKQLRSHEAKALYVGTSTVTAHHDGKVYNRKALFKRFHVLVLDDIGTKIPESRIPKDFEPSYIVETSEGNFQYGYVLDKPLTDPDQAFALISLVYESGFSDEGGKQVTKKVRVPQGVHGKMGSKDPAFRTKLHRLNDLQYSPAEILEELGISTSWEDVEKDAAAVARQNKSLGSSPWSPIATDYTTMDGITDPIAEWLGEQKMIINDNGEWLEIVCPWADQHTSADEQTAYYSPLGRGEGQYKAQRGYRCFHSHGESCNTQTFLETVMNMGAPEAPVSDEGAELIASCVYDSNDDLVWDIKESLYPQATKMKAFGNKYNKKHLKRTLTNTKREPKWDYISTAQIFMQSPNRVDVRGTTYDPTTTAKIVVEDGSQRLNTFFMPNYGQGRYDPEIVQVFLDYLEYLIPDKEERETFIEFLAAKFQNMGFRGWGILMIAQVQRTGRGTLETMCRQLFHPNNCANIDFDTLTGMKSNANHNEWQGRSLVFCSETQAMSNMGNFYRVYNKLKEAVDTTVQQVEINTKWGSKIFRNCYTSTVLFSNHALAAAIGADDERFYVITNTSFPRSADYFTMIREWMEKKDDDGSRLWCKHVARYLQTIKPDYVKLQGAAPMTQAKRNLLEAARSPLDIAVDTIFETVEGDYLTIDTFKRVLIEDFATGVRLGFDDDQKAIKIIRTMVGERTTPIHNKHQFKVDKVPYRAAIRNDKTNTAPHARLCSGEGTKDDKSPVSTGLRLQLYSIEKISEAVDEALRLEGF